MKIFFHFFCLLGMALVLAGCNGSGALVAIHTTAPRRSLSVNFVHAYFGRSAGGEDQIVLLRQPIDDVPDQSADQPLIRQTTPALSQVLVIQLHWRTAPAGNSDSPVANNAVLHWYVYGEPGETGMGVLQYVGSGAVSFSPTGPTASVSVHNAELSLFDKHGPLHDPLGTFKIDADFKASLDPQLMQQTMDDLNKAIAQSTASSTQP